MSAAVASPTQLLRCAPFPCEDGAEFTSLRNTFVKTAVLVDKPFAAASNASHFTAIFCCRLQPSLVRTAAQPQLTCAMLLCPTLLLTSDHGGTDQDNGDEKTCVDVYARLCVALQLARASNSMQTSTSHRRTYTLTHHETSPGTREHLTIRMRTRHFVASIVFSRHRT